MFQISIDHIVFFWSVRIFPFHPSKNKKISDKFMSKIMPLILLWQNKRTDLLVNLPLMFIMRLQTTQNCMKHHGLRMLMILNGMIIWSHQWSYQRTTKFYFPGSNMRRTLNTLKVSNYIHNDTFCCFYCLFVIQVQFLKCISQNSSVWEVTVLAIRVVEFLNGVYKIRKISA